MNKRVVRRGLETFFRRWWLFLLPLVLFAGVGVFKGAHSSSGYQSVGVIDVSGDTLLTQLTDIQRSSFGYETPSASTARTINSLLGTDQFIESVAKGAGVTGALRSGQLTKLGLQRALWVSTDGDNLVQIVAQTNNPELSAKLAKATIDGFIQYVVNGDISESKAAKAFFEDQLQTYRTALDQAQQNLADYATKHPGGPQQERPLTEQVAIQQLTSAVTQAQTQYVNAQQKSEEARLATEQATSNASERLRIIDEPKAAAGPIPRLKGAVTSFVIFVFAGFMLMMAAVVLGTVLDRSLHTADDVEALLQLPVLAVVPNASGPHVSKRARKKRARRDEADKEATPDVASARTDGRPPRVPGSTPRSASSSRRPEKVSATIGRRSEPRSATGDDLDGFDDHDTGLDPGNGSAHVERLRR